MHYFGYALQAGRRGPTGRRAGLLAAEEYKCDGGCAHRHQTIARETPSNRENAMHFGAKVRRSTPVFTAIITATAEVKWSALIYSFVKVRQDSPVGNL